MQGRPLTRRPLHPMHLDLAGPERRSSAAVRATLGVVRLHHLALRTDDLDRTARFYAGVLGLRVLRSDADRSVWLDAAGTILMLERRADGEPAIDPTSMELVCFAIRPGDHRATVERLGDAGVPVEGRTAYTIYFRDPDGRRLGASSYPEELAPL